jgi:peptide methionine sulfoxide reductase msrA/msrB
MDSSYKNLETATFAGGCFWCSESDFVKHDGVVEVVSGYTGGSKPNPTYEEVCSGTTGHYEAVQVFYDPEKVTYRELLEAFWRHIDPTDDGGQFVDRGPQYRSAIFYHNQEQRRQAEASKDALAQSGRFGKAIVTPVLPLTIFFKAEDYHQKYYQKSPLRYRAYRQASRRDRFIGKIWGQAVKDRKR